MCKFLGGKECSLCWFVERGCILLKKKKKSLASIIFMWIAYWKTDIFPSYKNCHNFMCFTKFYSLFCICKHGKTKAFSEHFEEDGSIWKIIGITDSLPAIPLCECNEKANGRLFPLTSHASKRFWELQVRSNIIIKSVKTIYTALQNKKDQNFVRGSGPTLKVGNKVHLIYWPEVNHTKRKQM